MGTFCLIQNFKECPGLVLSVLSRGEVRICNKWAEYTYMPIKVRDDITYKMYDYSREYRGHVIYSWTKQQCLEKLSLFPKINY